MPVSWGFPSLFTHILPYIEQTNTQNSAVTVPGGNWHNVQMTVYKSPLDFTSPNGNGPLGEAAGNIAENWQVFGGGGPFNMDGRARIPGTFKNGTSNTIGLATKYANCGSGGSAWPIVWFNPLTHNVTFGAHFGYTTFIPNAAGVGVTFQSRPMQPAAPGTVGCDPNYAQSFTTAGIQVAMMDGSVRTISPDVSGLVWRDALLPASSQPPNSGPQGGFTD